MFKIKPDEAPTAFRTPDPTIMSFSTAVYMADENHNEPYGDCHANHHTNKAAQHADAEPPKSREVELLHGVHGIAG